MTKYKINQYRVKITRGVLHKWVLVEAGVLGMKCPFCHFGRIGGKLRARCDRCRAEVAVIQPEKCEECDD